MYLPTKGTNERGQRPHAGADQLSLPFTDALGGAKEIEWVPGDSKFAMEPFFVARKG